MSCTEMSGQQQQITQNNVTLLAIVRIIPNGIEDRLAADGLTPNIAFKKEMTEYKVEFDSSTQCCPPQTH